MLEEYKRLRTACSPFYISSSDTCDGARIGGCPPQGIFPSTILASTRYLCTIPLNSIEMTIFTSFNHNNRNDGFWLDGMKILSTQNPIVQIILHSPQNRSIECNELSSELKSCGLDISRDAVLDHESLEGIVAHHKIGGFPFYHQDGGSLALESKLLLENNWYHVLQLAFPSWKDAEVGCSWPFGESVFHVFARESLSGLDYKYVWG